MQYYVPGEEEKIRICGRSKKMVPLPLFWTGSGIEFVVDGTMLELTFESDYTQKEQWIRILVNGFEMVRMPLPKGTYTMKLYDGLEKEERKTVRVIKEIQPMRDDLENCLYITKVATDGTIKDLPPKSCKLEFIGDSITSGEGLAGVSSIHGWIPMVFSTRDHYALSLENRIQADVRILSQSGWGTYCSWDNCIENVMPKYYEKVCGVLKEEAKNAQIGWEAHDFSSWRPDAVFVNLGTNDNGAFHSPAHVDEKTGKVYQQILAEDGSYDPASLKRFEEAVYAFLKKIRKYNEQAYIFWIYGMIGHELWESIEKTVERYKKRESDEKVEALLLPDTPCKWQGANNHPGAASHQAASKVIEEKLKSLGIL